MYLFILTLATSSLILIQCCPDLCLCNGTLVDCSYSGLDNTFLQSIFDHLPKNTTSLNMAYNNIDKLDVNKSMIFFDMKELNFTFNQLQAVPSNIFTMFPSLLKVDLSQNNISEVRRNDFNISKNLIDLRLDSNQLFKLENGSFDSLANLRFLKLTNNYITNISKSLFNPLKNLEVLDLTYNLITILTDSLFNFDHSPTLTILLAHNIITYVSNKVFKKDQYSAIDLSDNEIEEIGDKVFQNMTLNAGLFLNNNSIKSLSKSSMENLVTRALTLIHNPLICSCDLQKVLKEVVISSTIFEFLDGKCIPYNSTKSTSVKNIVDSWSDICEKCQQHDTCQNNGTCHPLNTTEFKCQCNEKFSGRICTKEKVCYPGKCLNNGICSPLNKTDFMCQCDKHYVGKKCEFSNPCASKPCQNDGVCTTEIQNKTISYSCRCKNSYVGKNCDSISSSRIVRSSLFIFGLSVVVCIVSLFLFV